MQSQAAERISVDVAPRRNRRCAESRSAKRDDELILDGRRELQVEERHAAVVAELNVSGMQIAKHQPSLMHARDRYLDVV